MKCTALCCKMLLICGESKFEKVLIIKISNKDSNKLTNLSKINV